MAGETNPPQSTEIDTGVSDLDIANQLTDLLNPSDGAADESLNKQDAVEDNPEDSTVIEDELVEESSSEDESKSNEEDASSEHEEEVLENVFAFEVEEGENIELSLEDVRNSVQLRQFMVENELKTVDDLRSGQMKNADYTQKTQKLADDRKVFEADMIAHQQAQSNLAQQLEVAAGIVDADLAVYANTDWAELQREDPAMFEEDFPKYMAAQKRQEKVNATIQQVVTEAEATNTANMQKVMEYEAEQLRIKMPDFADPVKAKALGEGMRTFLTSEAIGFSDEEVQVVDHRQVMVIQKAMAYDALLAKQKLASAKKVNKTPKRVIKAGTKVPKVDTKKRANAEANAALKKDGYNEAAAMEALNNLI